MIIGVLRLEIFLPYSRSLKDKRKSVKGFRDRVRNRYNAAVAELDFQDKWQRTVLGVVTLNSQPRLVDDLLNRILADAHNLEDCEVTSHEISYR